MVRCRSGFFCSRLLDPEYLPLSKQPFFRPELDVLRFLAFLLVFVHHSGLFSSGWLAEARVAGAFGLPLFFFLSAYLITELLDREFQNTGTIRLGAFYARRILRIWPLYLAAVILDFLHAQVRHPADFTPTRLAFYLLLAGNWYTALHGFALSFTLPLWSISVEEQFYVLWPSARRWLHRKGAISFSCAALALSYLVLYRECQHGGYRSHAVGQ